jgi:hypothetical protein
MLDRERVGRCLRENDFGQLFINELGWDRHSQSLDVTVDGHSYKLSALAQKRGVVAFELLLSGSNSIPPYPLRRKIERQVGRTVHEHLIIFTNRQLGTQTWQWVKREVGRPIVCREHTFQNGQSGEGLIQKLDGIAFTLEEEEQLSLLDVVSRMGDIARVERITRRFYDRFQTEHGAFLALIKGITVVADREWYASLMLNRLMFVYFIQKKGFLDADQDYLRNRLAILRKLEGKDKFLSFYRHFLLRLFHEGLGSQVRSTELDQLLGEVPFLNGGLFDVHQLERDHADIAIPDEAFENLFDFFDAYQWHLDERPLRADNEINPDVLGYIFEKYVNQKQMGAYYTKEDITEYIAKNTIIPFLFDSAENKCAIAFRPESALWQLLRDDPDRYLHDAMRYGVIDDQGRLIPLPKEIAIGVKDVAKRGSWNRPAPPEHALPTETWREHVARRARCLEVREKLVAGEIHAINDLVTYNLDIRQFAQDAIENCEGPELLRAFFHTIAGRVPARSNEKFEQGLSVLDPTCGSGAFLFAALNILEPLYEACLERMASFVADLERSDLKFDGKRFADFRKLLARVGQHPNSRYFILKSIIIGNLYGVDIIEEAVEICKLRLFLKLVGQVESVDQIEPLPDIDFNIRAGNTLVGFTSLDEVRRSLTRQHSHTETIKLMAGFEEHDVVVKIMEEAELADRAFQRFREIQTAHGMDAIEFHDAKSELRSRLQDLSNTLDRHLATEYSVDSAKPRNYARWRASHHPFHWIAEFYSIMASGGFDVIIGNPPYVELNAVTDYQVVGYHCVSAGNLYAVVLEQSSTLVSRDGYQGFIVPVSSISTDRYEALQQLLVGRLLHYSSFDDRPSRLFDGLEHIRLTIHLIGRSRPNAELFSTRYNKWNAVQRDTLFDTLTYVASAPVFVEGSFPKLTSDLERSIIDKLARPKAQLKDSLATSGPAKVFYSRKVGYFLQVLDFQPRVLDGRGRPRPPSEFKELRFATAAEANTALCCLNASLFYWFVTVFSDCRHVNKREVDAFPMNISGLAQAETNREITRLAKSLMKDIELNSETRNMTFRHDSLTVQCIIPKKSKRIIDDIDQLVGLHYEFTAEETDFIVNYDIKYRMGQGADETENV